MTSSPTAEIRIGTIIRDTYELTSLLGRGGMGAVFAARHLRLPGKQVAVKVLTYDEELTHEQLTRFRREAEIASQLGHPNIIEVFDFHTLENGTPYLVMELLRGDSLSRRIKRGPMPIPEVFAIARQMGSALQAAHRAGVVHRDLKPANVFLVPVESEGMVGERVKLLDFGISKILASQTLQTQNDVLMGTPRYMAPEQAMGRNKDVDGRTDLFAFAAILYEMLSGQVPFAGSSIAEIIYRVVNEPPEPLAQLCPQLPPQAAAAVERALAKSPQDRQPDVATFIAELTGTPLQVFPRQGADVIQQPRGALSQADASIPNPERDTGATFVRDNAAPAQSYNTQGAFSSKPGGAAPPPQNLPERTPPSNPHATVPGRASALEPPPPPPAPAAKRPGWVLPAILGGVVLLGGGILAATRLVSTPAPSAPPVSPPVVATEPKPTLPPNGAAPPPTTVVEAPPPTPEPQPEPPPSTPDGGTKTASTDDPPPPRSPGRTGKPEALPEAVKADLAAAEKALAAGNASEAVLLARKSLRTQSTGAAYALLTRAYCRLRDLSNAKAQWRNVPTAYQGKVRTYCKPYDIQF
ncbi:serine/threonine-protein kinase [Stigmatella erecta]|uniref:Serine/threonine protein kinase n=1 Tax=Stigmatella erecta TaxID=83460 RepID=A0A1I0KGD6_9BACT|nr:serine/threonine-protein kinase [Stigmatella erecta]SEU23483.1 serine/threonine protein kinase [Stigmatella erecta]